MGCHGLLGDASWGLRPSPEWGAPPPAQGVHLLRVPEKPGMLSLHLTGLMRPVAREFEDPRLHQVLTRFEDPRLHQVLKNLVQRGVTRFCCFQMRLKPACLLC